jgi:transcriptional regulator with XRE-family HTH domain
MHSHALPGLGERCREARGITGLNREKYSQALRIPTNYETVRSWEVGKNSPSAEFVAAICELTNVDANWLLGIHKVSRRQVKLDI